MTIINKDILSTFNDYVKRYNAYNKSELDQRKTVIDDMLAYQKTLPPDANTNQVKLRLLCCQFDHAFLSGQYYNAYTYFMNIKTLDPILEDYPYLAKLYRNMSLMSYGKSAFASAIENGFKALDYACEANDLYEEICACINIGLAYNLTEKHDKQIEFYQKAYELTIDSPYTELLPIILNNLAYGHLITHQYQACHKALKAGFKADGQSSTSSLHPALYLTSITLDLHEHKYEEAKSKLDALAKNPHLSVQVTVHLDWYIEMTDYYLNLNDKNQAIHTLHQGLDLAKLKGSNQYSIKFLSTLYRLAKDGGDFEEALAYQEEINQLKDIMTHDQEDYQYMLYQVQYEIKKMTSKVERLNSELQVTQESAIYALATIAEYRDEVTGKHILRTIEYMDTFLKLVNSTMYTTQMSENEIKLVAQSSALHDIGKVGIKDSILLKPGKLNSEEFEQIKRHTVIGRDALATTRDVLGNKSFLDTAMTIAYTHHERWDGSGYPSGLKGDEIPLYGRLVAIIDVYDALISKRPYKRPYTHLETLEILKKGRGGHFDPELLDLFIEHHLLFFEIALEHIDSQEEKDILIQGMERYLSLNDI